MPVLTSQVHSSIVEETLKRKDILKHSRYALPRACFNFIAAFFIYLDMCHGSLAVYFQINSSVFWYIELICIITLLLNSLHYFYRYVRPMWISQALQLTPNQSKLLGIKESDSGFRISPIQLFNSPSSSQAAGSSYFLSSSGYSGTATPLNISSISHLSSSSSQNSMSLHSLHWSPGTPPSLHSSINRHSSSPLSSNSSLPSLFRDPGIIEGNSLRIRHPGQSPPARLSPVSSTSCITDLRTLEEYLKDCEEKEQRSQLGKQDNSLNQSSSFWNFSRSTTDYSPLLRKYQYQIASRSPQSPTSRSDDDLDSPASYLGEMVWLKLGISWQDLDIWVENLRQWISQTIVLRFVEEIDQIDETFYRIGSADVKIGDTSITTLRQMALTKGQQLPTLNAVLPYLELTSNQQYLIQRIRDLARGGCMSEFKWDGGGTCKGKSWDHHLPTDCAIVTHLLCSYMDSRLPPHPKYPDGRTFTSQYFIKTPDKPEPCRKDLLCIYQSCIHPPHYKVIIKEDTWDLRKGRNNMFHAILLFLYHIKTKENGMLGRVNLGLSGVNILWIPEMRH